MSELLSKTYELPAMADYGFDLRKKFIRDYAALESKREALRSRMHAEGRYFVGEETLAKLNGGQVFRPKTGWKK